MRAGARIRIHGLGFSGVPGPEGYNAVVGGYFGVGTPGSVSNPLISVGNLSAEYVELWLPKTCDQEGILMLTAPPVHGGSEFLIVADGAPIIAGCAQDTPKGAIQGSEASADGGVMAQPGGTIAIRGTDLRYVTRVIDQQRNAYPFRFSKVGAGTAESELLTVTLPQTPGLNAAFLLENKLTDPVVAGTVNGFVRMPAPPSWYRIHPGWAEAGQTIWLAGHDLSSGARPTVTVGGVTAEVLPGYTDLVVQARLGVGTGAGPVVLKNPGGSVTLTGPFGASDGQPHPGFFVVNGASVVDGLSSAKAALTYQDTVTVSGRNLARLGGVCVMGAAVGNSPSPGYLPLRRTDMNRAQNGLATSNTQMEIQLLTQPYFLQKGTAIQIYAPTTPPGDLL